MEELQLSSSTLAALQEFMTEENERKEQFAKLQTQAEQRAQEAANDHGEDVDMSMFQEDWQLSQFWYSEKTSDALVEELLNGADENTVIGILSAPSVYAHLKKRKHWPTKRIYLFEYDDRFKLLAGNYFQFYDYNKPTELPKELKHTFDRVFVDPPFLQEDCQRKEAETAQWLLKTDRSEYSRHGELQHKTIVCTGERMKQVIAKLYPDTLMTDFHPEHSNGLSNEFRCYATKDCKYLHG